MFFSVLVWFWLIWFPMQGEGSEDEDEGDEEEGEDDEDDDKWTLNGPCVWFEFSSSMFQLS